MSANQSPVSDVRWTQTESWEDQHTMVYTIGKMLDADVQRIGASRSTVFLAADFEIQLAIEEQLEHMNLVIDSPAVDNEQQNEMNLDQVELPGETAAVPIEATGTPSDVGEPQQSDNPIQVDENASEDDEDFCATMRRLNPNVDRTPALRFEPDESKLFIQLVRPSGHITPYRYCDPVDWTQPMTKLNLWRYGVFRRYLGPLAGPLPTKLHPLEIRYILDAPNHSEKWGYGPNRSKIEWVKFHKAFNERFQGKALPGYPGPRPARTVNALRNALQQYYAKGAKYYKRTRRQKNHASEGQ
jgi:hypothetical protein